MHARSIHTQTQYLISFRALWWIGDQRKRSSVAILRSDETEVKDLEIMVGASGFEPPTSWSRTRRASQAALRPDRGSLAMQQRKIGTPSGR
jgi:hypothetical protein